jgi:hypothetical protein
MRNAALSPENHRYTCATCDVKYATKGRFMHHMNAAPHNHPTFDWMFKKSKKKVSANNSSANGPPREYFCPACDNMAFNSKEEHRKHLDSYPHYTEIYKMKYLKLMVEEGALPNLDEFFLDVQSVR